MDAPLVSIIIPTFNYANFLPQAINSALKQTYCRCEILVIDDGSTDDTKSVALSYGEKIRYLPQKNQGLSAARNSGIENAKGEWLAFLDADDTLHPGMVEASLKRAISTAENHSEKNIAIVAHLPERIDQHGKTTRKVPVQSTPETEVSMVDLLVMNRFPATVLGRARTLKELGGFDIDLAASEDRDMWIRVAAKHRVIRLNQPLSSVRRHGNSMSSHGERQAESIHRVQNKARQANYLTGWKTIYWLKIHAFFLFQRAMMCGKSSPLRALRDLIVSGLLWPWFLDYKTLNHRLLFRFRHAGWILKGCP